MNDSYDEYRAVDLEVRVCASSPYELVLVLFDGLLDELNRARGHIETSHYELKGVSLEKCMNILNALNSTLDYEQGGEPLAPGLCWQKYDRSVRGGAGQQVAGAVNAP